MPDTDRRQVWAKSDAVLAELDGVAWAHSYVTDDRFYCVHYADDPELSASTRAAGGPCDTILPVDDVVDPTRA